MSFSTVDAIRIVTDPDPCEPFKIAIGYRIGDLVILSGQASVDGHGKTVGVGDFDTQADQVFANIASGLAAAGSSMQQIFKVTIYLTDMSNYDKILALRERYFTKPYPADTIVEVTSLAMAEYMIEIEVMALCDGKVRDP
jgi:enamine deaminase RidA (YjgF/YER057c/UK114 family)